MELFEQLEWKMAEIDREMQISAEREGLPKGELTGRIIMDSPNEALWWEVLDLEYHVLSFVSIDFPDRTAHGEKLVGVADESEIKDYARDNEEGEWE